MPEEVAARARSFGHVADDYEEARPGYPPEAVAWLLGPTPLDVADVGAGTGKLTSGLLAAGHRVVAVEPLDPLRAKLAAALPAARALPGRAEELPLPDAGVDAVENLWDERPDLRGRTGATLTYRTEAYRCRLR